MHTELWGLVRFPPTDEASLLPRLSRCGRIMDDMSDDDALQGYANAKARLSESLREMTSLLDDSSPLEAALSNVASAAIEQLDVPTPGHTLPAWEAFRMPVPIALDPPYQRPVLPEGCYDASFGRVHVRPGCRC